MSSSSIQGTRKNSTYPKKITFPLVLKYKDNRKSTDKDLSSFATCKKAIGLFLPTRQKGIRFWTQGYIAGAVFLVRLHPRLNWKIKNAQLRRRHLLV